MNSLLLFGAAAVVAFLCWRLLLRTSPAPPRDASLPSGTRRAARSPHARPKTSAAREQADAIALVHVVPDQLQVGVFAHVLATADGPVPVWTYLSTFGPFTASRARARSSTKATSAR